MQETNWIWAYEKIGKETKVKLITTNSKMVSRSERKKELKTVQTIFENMENILGNILEKRDKTVKLWHKGLTKNEKVSEHCWKCFFKDKRQKWRKKFEK